jgi:adenine-specific DNA-methyltransferase
MVCAEGIYQEGETERSAAIMIGTVQRQDLVQAAREASDSVIFGEPDIDLIVNGDDMMQIKVNDVDVFHPIIGEDRRDGPDGIARWIIDPDYDEECFFVRYAYLHGQNDPHIALKTTLKAEINAWSTLHTDTFRPLEEPTPHRSKGASPPRREVMRVFRV